MTDRKTLRRQILDLVREYHAAEPNKPFRPGEDPVRYAGHCFDEKELMNLVDASLDFWLTAGRCAEELEAGLGEFLFTGGCAYAEEWSFGPADEDLRSVRWIVERVVAASPGATWECEPQPHEAHYLKLDSSKAHARLGWQPN